MAGRGPQSFKKRQKEQQRKEKQQEKLAKRLERKRQALIGNSNPDESTMDGEIGTDTEDETAGEVEESWRSADSSGNS